MRSIIYACEILSLNRPLIKTIPTSCCTYRGSYFATVDSHYCTISIEPGTEPKLFIGNLPGDITESALDALLRPYGGLEKVAIIPKTSPTGNKSAFAFFDTIDFCHAIIKSLHGQYTYPGCVDTMVVRFADTAARREEKFQRQQAGVSLAYLHCCLDC